MGSHLARRLINEGHEPVLVARRERRLEGLGEAEVVAASVTDGDALEEAFGACDAVAHLAGINLERGQQTYEAVHVRGTRNAVRAAEEVGAEKFVVTSFLRARQDCGSGYHESKWRKEEIVRNSGLDYTVLKPGVTYGRGDHLLTHISRALKTFPVFGLVGFDPVWVRPLDVEDLVDVMMASIVRDRLSGETVWVVGPEEITGRTTVERIAEAIGVNPRFVRLPVWLHYAFAWTQERMMRTPVVSLAQVRILSEDVVEPAPREACEPLSEDLEPAREFSVERIREGLGDVRRYGVRDLRL